MRHVLHADPVIATCDPIAKPAPEGPSAVRPPRLVTPRPAPPLAAVAPPLSSRGNALIAAAGLMVALAVVAAGALHALLR